MNRKLRHILASLGLNEKEIKIYLLLCKYKQLTLAELVYRSKLPQTTVYRVLQSLESDALIQTEAINKKQRIYRPQRILALARKVSKEQRRLKKLERTLQTLHPYLSYLEEDDTQEEGIVLQEGKDAFREAFLNLPTRCTDEYLAIGNVDRFWQTSQYDYECPEIRHFVHYRLRNNIHARECIRYSKEAQRIQRNDSREKRTLLLKESLPIMQDKLVITDHQVSHFVCNPDAPKVITIRTPELVQMHKQHFAMLWER